ncbi:MAG: hypothetical protein KJ949_02735 [Nanoarchaeota archaeon]|nr:hypothetical protein [Nanoarchaeota archaeon]
MEKEKSLEKLKEKYLEIQKRFGLPDFDELNREFQIEKIDSDETDYLIREIRKFFAEKFSNYMRFVEALLNPSNSPLFVFSIVKSLNSDDKTILQEVYKKLAKIEVDLIEVDLDFSEEKEAEFIKETYKVWKEIKKDLLKTIEVVKKNWDNKFEDSAKGYFG